MKNTQLLLLALSLATPIAYAEGTDAPPKPHHLSGIRCLDPGPASGWTYLDDSHILIDGGPYRYSVEFLDACWGLKFENSLAFRGDPFSGRVCGDTGDEVIVKNMHCRIKHMEIISSAQYRQTIKDNKAAIEARKLERAEAKKLKTP